MSKLFFTYSFFLWDVYIALCINIRKEFFKTVMVQMIKDIVEEIRKMIVALVEFDYEEALEEMNKN
ncbi:hypothetical protein BSM4216_1212 [Bacillus smithii]|nr:hypothetical protein BSM4216_1212 [Bacillus smithii]